MGTRSAVASSIASHCFRSLAAFYPARCCTRGIAARDSALANAPMRVSRDSDRERISGSGHSRIIPGSFPDRQKDYFSLSDEIRVFLLHEARAIREIDQTKNALRFISLISRTREYLLSLMEGREKTRFQPIARCAEAARSASEISNSSMDPIDERVSARSDDRPRGRFSPRKISMRNTAHLETDRSGSATRDEWKQIGKSIALNASLSLSHTFYSAQDAYENR